MTDAITRLDYADLISPSRGTRFAVLRRAQEIVLTKYADAAHALSDIAVELPTGAGKTLIALLVLDFWRRQGRRVAVLTGNKTLARQIEREAAELRVPTVRFEGRGRDFPPGDLRRYHRAQAIAVMNYWAYVNQKPAMEPAEYLVLDDAQLADGALSSLYTASVSRYDHETLFATLMRLIFRASDSPIAEDVVKEITAGASLYRNADLVAFPHFARVRDEFEVAVDEYLTAKPDGDSEALSDLRFRWTRVRPNLDLMVCVLSLDEIELRPVCYPTQQYEGLRAPTQRIFMSATLHDPGDLQRRLGSRPITKIDLPPDATVEQDGRRLFVFNQQASLTARFAASEEVLAPLRELLALTGKSVWLCSSGAEADHWTRWLATWLEAVAGANEPDPVWRLTPTGDELDEFRDSSAGHLIIAGRFEGMDFPDEICRLAVLPSLPSATGLLERFTTEQLRDARFQHLRILERVKQGIGRCTRGDSDYAVYFFLDPRFYIEMESGDFGALVSERTRRQIELGLQLTEDGMGSVVPVARRFLGGDFSEFDGREAAADPPPARPRLSVAPSTASEEVLGWLGLVARHDFAAASTHFERVAQQLQDAEREHRAFWRYQQAFAEYMRADRDQTPGAREKCLALLEMAIKEGSSSSWFNRLRRATNELRQEAAPSEIAISTEIFDVWDQFVERHPYQGGRFLRWQARLQGSIAGTHNQVCEALETIGTLLGFAATRPTGNAAADGLWRVRDAAVTLEAKIEVTRAAVAYGDVNQADGQRRGMVQTLSLDDSRVDALIVTNLEEIDAAAAAALARVRIVTIDTLERLRVRLEEIARDYWSTWSRQDADRRRVARETAAQRLPPDGWLTRAIAASDDPFIPLERLLAEWP